MTFPEPMLVGPRTVVTKGDVARWLAESMSPKAVWWSVRREAWCIRFKNGALLSLTPDYLEHLRGTGHVPVEEQELG